VYAFARCPSVFDLQRRPWVDIEGAEADVIADAITRYPTGALGSTAATASAVRGRRSCGRSTADRS
jgi:hypothetical protein